MKMLLYPAISFGREEHAILILGMVCHSYELMCLLTSLGLGIYRKGV